MASQTPTTMMTARLPVALVRLLQTEATWRGLTVTAVLRLALEERYRLRGGAIAEDDA